jgi:hypothetical protein
MSFLRCAGWLTYSLAEAAPRLVKVEPRRPHRIVSGAYIVRRSEAYERGLSPPVLPLGHGHAAPVATLIALKSRSLRPWCRSGTRSRCRLRPYSRRRPGCSSRCRRTARRSRRGYCRCHCCCRGGGRCCSYGGSGRRCSTGCREYSHEINVLFVLAPGRIEIERS